jgi:adenine-specific DNA-methyltransferase
LVIIPIQFYFTRKKGINNIWNDLTFDISNDDIEKLFPKVNLDGRKYTTHPLHAPGETRDGPTGQMWNGMMPPEGRHWRLYT